MPLISAATGLWRQGCDAGGEIDVAVIELDRANMPPSVVLYDFNPSHLTSSFTQVEAGESLLSSLDVGDRDHFLDDSLGLNCVWYANILLTLTEAQAEPLPVIGLGLAV